MTITPTETEQTADELKPENRQSPLAEIDLTEPEPAEENVERKAGKDSRNWVARGALFLAIAVLAVLVVDQIQGRISHRNMVGIDETQLTADTNEIGTAGGGRLVAINVAVGDEVSGGDVLGVIETEVMSFGWTTLEEIELVAPADGEVYAVNHQVGQLAEDNETIFGIYDPETLHFLAPVTTGSLASLRTGMDVTVQLPLGGEIDASLGEAVPRFDLVINRADIDRDRVYLRIEPDNPDQLAGSLPGIVTNGQIDTATSPDGNQYLTAKG